MKNIIQVLTKTNLLRMFVLVSITTLLSCAEDPADDIGSVIETTPKASFTATADSGDWLIYKFINKSTNASSYSWNFGDGTTSEEKEPLKTYEADGEYTIALTATDALGNSSSIEEIINVADPVVPVPSFTTEEESEGSLTINFTNTSKDATTYSWDFGDTSGTSTDKDPTYTYASNGRYNVVLTAFNSSGILASVTISVAVGPVDATFKAIVLNSGGDDLTLKTSDNADAFDMSPPATIYDAPDTADSPYIWKNSALDTWLGDDCGNGSEQPSSTSDGTFDSEGNKTRAYKLNSACRRLYQPVTVEPGVKYTFTIDTRSEVEGINTEIFILNNAIESETAIDLALTNEVSEDTKLDYDAYYKIDNDFNSSKGSADVNTFTKTTFVFEPTVSEIIIYVRAKTAVDNDNEVFIDNVDIITPGF